jgi:hypothetical protein
MKQAVLLSLALSLGVLSAQAEALSNADLWRPRFATPALVALDSQANRVFTAEIRGHPQAGHWEATLSNDLAAWPCTVLSASYAKINNDTEPGWKIRLEVPRDISPELFTLALSSSEGAVAQRQSVSVSPAFATNFYILHLTDEQIVNKIHTDPSGQYLHMVGSWDEMLWMQEPVNLINPRFVLVTGDQIDFNGALDGWNNWVNWGYKPRNLKKFTRQETLELENRLSVMYKDCHVGYAVPYAETPGNHDVTPPGKLLSGSAIDWYPISSRVYEEQFGQRSWSFRMGDFYVLLHDWASAPLQAWAARDYAEASHDPAVKFRLIGEHFHTKWDGAPTGNFAFHPAECDLMLIGHGHKELTIQTSPYYIYMDGPSFHYGMVGFFNFNRTANGWTCDQTTHPRSYTNDVWPLFESNGVRKKVWTDQPDPRHLTTNSVTVHNQLPQRFYDGRLRFVLDHGSYTRIQNGTILAAYDCAGGRKTALLVRVDIPARGSVTVTIPSPPVSHAAADSSTRKD